MIKKLVFALLSTFVIVGCSTGKSPSPIPSLSVFKSEIIQTPERKRFYDYLAAQHPKFNIRNATAFVSFPSGVGTLDYTFGDSLTPILKLLDSKKFDFYRVHFINGSGVNNGLPAPYEITRGMSKADLDKALRTKDRKLYSYLEKRLGLYCSLIPQYPNITFAFSPILEGRVSKTAWQVVNQFFVDTCKNPFVLINSALETPNYTNGAKEESHGNKPHRTAYLTSLDGDEAFDIDSKAWWNRTKDNAYTGIWTRSFNCRNQGPWQDPRSRTSCPTRDIFEASAHIPDDRGPLPPPNNCKPFNSEWIWKNLSEDKGVGDIRANKPVLIVPFQQSNVKVLDIKKSTIGSLGFFGPYSTPGTWRYYSNWAGGTGESGYGFEKKSMQSSSSRYNYLQMGNNCYGPLTLGIRQGTFR